jgi:hypothetical protein
MREQVTVDVTDQPDGDTDGGEIVVDGPDTIALLKREIDTAQDQNRRALIKLKPHELARFETWLRTRTHTEPPVQPTPARPTNGHAPREARNDRPRGSKRRGERSKSSSSDDPDPEPEPAERRLCGNKRCQADISHLRPDARSRPRSRAGVIPRQSSSTRAFAFYAAASAGRSPWNGNATRLHPLGRSQPLARRSSATPDSGTASAGGRG